MKMESPTLTDQAHVTGRSFHLRSQKFFHNYFGQMLCFSRSNVKFPGAVTVNLN